MANSCGDSFSVILLSLFGSLRFDDHVLPPPRLGYDSTRWRRSLRDSRGVIPTKVATITKSDQSNSGLNQANVIMFTERG